MIKIFFHIIEPAFVLRICYNSGREEDDRQKYLSFTRRICIWIVHLKTLHTPGANFSECEGSAFEALDKLVKKLIGKYLGDLIKRTSRYFRRADGEEYTCIYPPEAICHSGYKHVVVSFIMWMNYHRGRLTSYMYRDLASVK